MKYLFGTVVIGGDGLGTDLRGGPVGVRSRREYWNGVE